MVDCCASPGCRADFRQFNSGDLYALERRSENTEFFWLCSECAPRFDLLLDSEGRLTFQSRGDRSHHRPANPEGTLRLISSSAHHVPWHHSAPSDEPRVAQNFHDRGGFAN
jgi:hypothetical protein